MLYNTKPMLNTKIYNTMIQQFHFSALAAVTFRRDSPIHGSIVAEEFRTQLTQPITIDINKLNQYLTKFNYSINLAQNASLNREECRRVVLRQNPGGIGNSARRRKEESGERDAHKPSSPTTEQSAAPPSTAVDLSLQRQRQRPDKNCSQGQVGGGHHRVTCSNCY